MSADLSTATTEVTSDRPGLAIAIHGETIAAVDAWLATRGHKERDRQHRDNAIALAATGNYLQLLGYEVDLEGSDLWNPVLRELSDPADLPLPGLGWLECRVFPADAAAVSLSAVPDPARIGYVGVALSAETPYEAYLLGFAAAGDAQSPPSQLQRQDLGTIDDLVDILTRLELLNEIIDRQPQSYLAESREAAIAELERVYRSSPDEPWEWADRGKPRLFGSETMPVLLKEDAVLGSARETAPDQDASNQRKFIETVLTDLDQQWRQISN